MGAFLKSVVITVVAFSAVAAYLVVPAVGQWTRAEARANINPEVYDQVETPPQDVDDRLVEKLRNATTGRQSAPLVITYHDIGDRDSRYTLTPQAFEAQMQTLHRAGWRTIGSDDLVRWLHGEPVPPHSVLITFDDGAKGVWKYADPILRRYGFNAVSFVVTGFVGTRAPYYMTWQELTRLHESGRWELQAHTHLGHVHIPTDAEGGEGPFLTKLRYLTDKRRVETSDEYAHRVVSDLDEGIRQFALHDLPAPTLFAYPFSDLDDAPTGTGVLRDALAERFAASLSDTADRERVTNTEDVSAGLVARMDITSDVSTADWVDRLVAASPLEPRFARPLADPGGWTDYGARPVRINIDGNGTALLEPAPREHLGRRYAPQRSSMWDTYGVSVDVGNFRSATDGTTAGVMALSGDAKHEVDVSIGRSGYTINVGREPRFFTKRGKLADTSSHHVDIDVSPNQVIVRIDGALAAEVPLPAAPPRQKGGGVGLHVTRAFDSSPAALFANLTVR
ncbi:polysaccharide deacetylase family protein [Mycobacterium sp. IS-1742]|uniref:polysaccharide deacetylase family protein n=1 Tax=Mycobacterium sp. IS-1742 TaxID=1772285 RepID=UPI001E51C581|nr:polysaccharide deacetylase family protein [Mycobacterium sp. IS-1742]